MKRILAGVVVVAFALTGCSSTPSRDDIADTFAIEMAAAGVGDPADWMELSRGIADNASAAFESRIRELEGTPETRDNIVWTKEKLLNIEKYVGPVWDKPFTQRHPTSGITIKLPKGTYEGVEFWGQIEPTEPGVIFKNCIFRGPDPSKLTNQPQGVIKNFGKNPPFFQVFDSLIDPSAWSTFGQNFKSGLILGVHGGNFQMERTEVVGLQDAFNYIGPYTSAPVAPDTEATRLERARAARLILRGNWIHKGWYMNPWFGPTDGQPHSDGFQINTGKNLLIEWNVIGGKRDVTGYLKRPGGYNAGDDFWNAAMMLKQEVNVDPTNKIENVIIRNNLFGGGAATINHAWNASRPNDWPGFEFYDNWFMQRGRDWGQKITTRDRGATWPRWGVRWDYYYAVHPIFKAKYLNNRILETDQLINP